jgi:hypothetical protein
MLSEVELWKGRAQGYQRRRIETKTTGSERERGGRDVRRDTGGGGNEGRVWGWWSPRRPAPFIARLPQRAVGVSGRHQAIGFNGSCQGRASCSADGPGPGTVTGRAGTGTMLTGSCRFLGRAVPPGCWSGQSPTDCMAIYSLS